MATEHPDRSWIAATIADLEEWSAAPAGFPTSQITGGGAIAEAERQLSALHEDRAAILIPSASFGLRTSLSAVGVGAGDEVLVPAVDWTATFSAVRSLGAFPVPVRVDSTHTIDPEAAEGRRTTRTRAVVACHLFGIPADVASLRAALPGLPIVEDAAQSLGSRLDGRPVGALGDIAVLSFGPGKQVDVGEGAAIIVCDELMREAVERAVSHPVRQRCRGVRDVDSAAFSLRVHPVAAVRLALALKRFDPAPGIAARRRLAASATDAGYAVAGGDLRREMARPEVVLAAMNRSILGPPFELRRYETADIAALVGGRTAMVDIPYLASSLTKSSTKYPTRTGAP